jgi:hypothetical protein
MKIVGIVGLVVVLWFIVPLFRRDEHDHGSGGHGRLYSTEIS